MSLTVGDFSYFTSLELGMNSTVYRVRLVDLHNRKKFDESHLKPGFYTSEPFLMGNCNIFNCFLPL